MGWLTKTGGRWYLTSLGRTALVRYPEAADFFAAAEAGYRYWDRHKAGFDMAKRLAEAVPEGSRVAADDLAVQVGVDVPHLVRWFQGERSEGWHRVLDSDGGIPDDAHADEQLRKFWHGLLDEDGLHTMLGVAPVSQRVSGADLGQLIVDNVDPDNPERPRRAWLVRGSNVHGMSLVRGWLDEGYCSLPASNLRELPADATQETVRAAVDEGYGHGSYNDRLKKTAEFHAFLPRMREGDLVLSNEGAGVCSSIYLAEPDQAVDLVRRRANVVIHEMVDVLRPFYRDGRHIPPLLRPRAHVTVDPAVRGGVPVIEGTRVPYDEVAALIRDGLPAERTSEYHPSVTPVVALDAADYVSSHNLPKEPRSAPAPRHAIRREQHHPANARDRRHSPAGFSGCAACAELAVTGGGPGQDAGPCFNAAVTLGWVPAGAAAECR